MTSRSLPRLATIHKIPRPTHHVNLLISPPRLAAVASFNPSSNSSRSFERRASSATSNPPLLQKLSSNRLPPRPKPPPDEEIEESFLKGSGPGGQKINKTNSAVQLKHIPTGLVVKCQATRSRSQNRTIARQLLADKLDDMTRGDASRSSVVGEVKRKKKASSAKKSRRKYRKLEGEKEGALSDGNTSLLLEGEEEEGCADSEEPSLEKGGEILGGDKDKDTTGAMTTIRIESRNRI
ncbi:RF-1 domain-containing protein [Xylaria arbuscula]|nr:RF-1 domain-containing protein [Xylaria arbuscula]